MPIRGAYRIKNTPPDEDGVWVTDGTVSFEISEFRYRDRGYQPRVESLPWSSRRRDRGISDGE